MGGKRYAWKLLVERVTADQQPRVMGNQPATGAASVPLTVVEGAGAPSYAVDVRTAAGPVSHLTGVTLDANNRFLLDQAYLSPGATNWVRVKAEGAEGAVYSRAVRVVLNPAAVPGGENQIRAVSLSRSGTDIVVRWGLAAENGKPKRVYFKRSDNGAVTLLTPTALNAGVRSYTLSAQGLSSPCGDFHIGQVGPDGVESPQTPALFFAGIDLGIGHEGGCIGPSPNPEPPRWADYLHARDHLGTLRLVTDISGSPIEAHDYEPFGLELVPPGETAGTLSTRKFTGHERDASTGLDYMMARYYPASLARFLSVDPGFDAKKETPQSWNLFSYVRNNPVGNVDPTGKATDANSYPSPEEIKEIANQPPTPETSQQKLVSTLCMAPLGVLMAGTAVAHLPEFLLVGANALLSRVPQIITTLNNLAAGSAGFSIKNSPTSSPIAEGMVPQSLGAAARTSGEALQTGGSTIQPRTAQALNKALGENLRPREWGRALEMLKKDNGLPRNFHGTITSTGDYLDSKGAVIDNLLGYTP